jgi:CHAT domain-containing protein
LDERAELEELVNPTVEALRTTFARRPHVLHLLGHGAPGELALRAADGDGLWYADQSLADRLRNSGVRLAVLQACEGAAVAEDQSFAGSAAWLVRQHVPAVVGLRYPIAQPAAWRFVKRFYRDLAEGAPVDFAVGGLPGGDSGGRLVSLCET